MGFLALFEMTALHKSFSQWLLKFTRVFTRSKGVVNLRTANCKTCRVSYVLCAFFLLEMSMLLVLAMQNLEKCLSFILICSCRHCTGPVHRSKTPTGDMRQRFQLSLTSIFILHLQNHFTTWEAGGPQA